MITVVIPLYNKAATVARAIESVRRQTFRDFEIVVVDNGSTDHGADVVKNMRIPYLRLISQENAGVSAARNRGIKEARGEFVAFLDAGDEWKPFYLETQAELAGHYPLFDMFATNYVFCDDRGKLTPTVLRRLPFNGESGELNNFFEVASHSHSPLCASAVMVSKAALKRVGGFPEEVKSGEDILMWARLAVRGFIAYNRLPLAICHVESNPKRLSQAKDAESSTPALRIETQDLVGEELRKLARDYKPRHIHAYISHWHKIRASHFLRLGMRKECLREALQGLAHRPLNWGLYIYLLQSLGARESSET